MKKFLNTALTLAITFSSGFAFSETISLVCTPDKEGVGPIPLRFIRNTNRTLEMYRFDANENREIPQRYGPPWKSKLINLQITKSEISYKTKLEASSHSDQTDKNSPLVPMGDTRTGAISLVDGSWSEYVTSYGFLATLSGDEHILKGKCEPKQVSAPIKKENIKLLCQTNVIETRLNSAPMSYPSTQTLLINEKGIVGEKPFYPIGFENLHLEPSPGISHDVVAVNSSTAQKWDVKNNTKMTGNMNYSNETFIVIDRTTGAINYRLSDGNMHVLTMSGTCSKVDSTKTKF